MSTQKLFLIGAPYSGVDELAKMLAEALGVEFIHFSKVIEKHLESLDDVPHKRQGAFMRKGVILRDDVVQPATKILLQTVKDLPGFVVSGYPRTRSQVGMIKCSDEIGQQNVQLVALNGLNQAVIWRRAGRVYSPSQKDLCAMDRYTHFSKFISGTISDFDSNEPWSVNRIKLDPEWQMKEVFDEVCDQIDVPSERV